MGQRRKKQKHLQPTRSLPSPSPADLISEQYRAVNDLWSPFSTMLEYRNFYGQCVFEGKVYVSGGENAQGAKLASCECYDPSTDMWTSIPSMPVASSSQYLCAIEGAIYNFDLWSVVRPGESESRVYMLNLASGMWSEVTLIPPRRNFASIISRQDDAMAMFLLPPDTVPDPDTVPGSNHLSWRTLHSMLTSRYDHTWLFLPQGGSYSYNTSKTEPGLIYKYLYSDESFTVMNCPEQSESGL